jgi:GNAT superfamily N-acetyltransferase
MFESVNDPTVARSLLDAAAGWLLARGRTAIRGPIDYSLNYPCGLLVDGFQTPPRIMMNHNPPYYAALLESWGLVKAKDLYSWWFVDPYDMVSQWHRRAEWLARRGGVRVRPFRKKDFEADVERCRDLYCSAYEDAWGFVRLTDTEFRYLAGQLERIAVPEMVLLAEVEGKPVGFSITVPDMHEAIRPLNGRLTTLGLPIGLARLAYRVPRIKTARMLVLVVLEGYRRRGVSELLILSTLQYGKNVLGYTGAELGWTLEDNDLINRTIEAVGARRVGARQCPRTGNHPGRSDGGPSHPRDPRRRSRHRPEKLLRQSRCRHRGRGVGGQRAGAANWSHSPDHELPAPGPRLSDLGDPRPGGARRPAHRVGAQPRRFRPGRRDGPGRGGLNEVA